MPPVMRDDVADSSGFVLPSIDVTLKPGWSFDAARRVFVSEDGERVSPSGDLPRGTKIVPLVPSLAASGRKRLSAPEKLLARSMQVILPKGDDAEHARRVIDEWACVERADLPPAIGLPSY